MGQKVNPHGLRVGVIKDWDSKWYAEADFADNLIEDYEIRTYLKKNTAQVFLRLKSKDHLTE
jgi:small subunit ribosomal protein S3